MESSMLRQRDTKTEKILLSLSGLMILFAGMRIWVFSTSLPLDNVVATLSIAGGLSVALFGFVLQRRSHVVAVEWLCVALFLLTCSAYVISAVYTQPYYGTDEIAFDQYAAQLLLHGIDPYGVNLSHSFSLFQVPAIFRTYTITGGVVDHLSYPALSFLAYVPALLLGIHVQVAVMVDTVAWLLVGLLLYVLLPRPYKMLSVVLGSLIVYQEFVAGGVVATLALPLLIVAAYRWDRFGQVDETSFARWAGPVFLALADCVDPTAWFLTPFVLLGIYNETKSWRPVLRYVIAGVATFGIVNLPFIIWHPIRWINGILLPFLSPNIPSGQGLINLTMFEHMGGGRFDLYTLGAIFVVVGLLLVEWLFYAALKPILFLLPSVILFFPDRSFSSYLIFLFPIAVVGLTTVASPPGFNYRIARPMRIRMAVLGFLPALACLLAAVTIPPPLKLQVLSVRTTGELGSIEQIAVGVRNVSGRVQRPHFTISVTPQVTTFWNVVSGPPRIPPGKQYTYLLDAPNVPSMPPISGGFLVDAFSTNPASLSTSAVYQPQVWHTYITRDSVDGIQQLHHAIKIDVELLDKLGRPTRISGVPVALSQVVYNQNGLYGGETSINGQAEGQSPVTAITNADGVAAFVIEAEQAQADPVYYQAYISPASSYPYGYSEIVSIRFQ